MVRLVCVLLGLALRPGVWAFAPKFQHNRVDIGIPQKHNRVDQYQYQRTLTLAEAQAVLTAFEHAHVSATRTGGASAANAYAASQPRVLLAEAVQTLLHSNNGAASVRLGICTPNGASAIATLRSWVDTLGLPRGTLFGADVDGAAIPSEQLGASYIKYSARAGSTHAADGAPPAPPGSARLEKYGSSFCGVTLAMGVGKGFRSVGLLPLGLFDAEVDRMANLGTSGLWAAREPKTGAAVPMQYATAAANARQEAKPRSPLSTSSDYVDSQLEWTKQNARRRAASREAKGL
jgi:hypothetical protein